MLSGAICIANPVFNDNGYNILTKIWFRSIMTDRKTYRHKIIIKCNTPGNLRNLYIFLM